MTAPRTKRIVLITTGGTIEKTYDERSGDLTNRQTLVHRMLDELRLEDTRVSVLELMSKDSLDMTDEDRRTIADAVALKDPEAPVDQRACDGVVVLHGTDTLSETGRVLHDAFPALAVPVVLTGALRPFEMKRSDALQNLTEAIFAAGALDPGVYCVAHGRALRFPGVVKDHNRGTFIREP